MATKRRHFVEQVEGFDEEARTAIESDEVAKESFFRSKLSFLFQLKEDFLHLIEHFGAPKFGNNEIVIEKGVAKGFVMNWGSWVRFEKEIEREFRVLLETKKRRKPEGRDRFK